MLREGRTEPTRQASWRRRGGRREDGLGGVGEETIINVSASLDAELSQMLSTLTGPQLARVQDGGGGKASEV